MNYEARISRVRAAMADRGISAMFLPSSGDRQYITGIPSERPCTTHHHRSGDWLDGIFLTQNSIIYTVPWMMRSFAQAQAEDKKYINEVVILQEGEDYRNLAGKVLEKLKLHKGTVAVPKGTMSKSVINLSQVAPELDFTNTEAVTCPMRMIKEAEEIEIMKEASRIADEAFLAVIGMIAPGVTEYEIAARLDYEMIKRGAECVSFPTDVMIKGPGIRETGGSGFAKAASGCNIAFDFGCVYQGYCSDFGRTVYVGEPTEEYRRIHELVMKSQLAAASAAVPGRMTAVELDKTARRVINEGGYYDEFFHRLGHGIGIDVHEYPYLNKGYTEPLQTGMTVTIEPSVMIEGKLRIRVEDIYHITENGAESFNKVTKEMIVL